MKKKWIIQVVNEDRNDEVIFKGEFYSEESLLEFIGKPKDRVMREYVDGIRPMKKEVPEPIKEEQKPIPQVVYKPEPPIRTPDGGTIEVNEGGYNPITGERY
jgi:hypothetical protein